MEGPLCNILRTKENRRTLYTSTGPDLCMEIPNFLHTVVLI